MGGSLIGCATNTPQPPACPDGERREESTASATVAAQERLTSRASAPAWKTPPPALAGSLLTARAGSSPRCLKEWSGGQPVPLSAAHRPVCCAVAVWDTC